MESQGIFGCSNGNRGNVDDSINKIDDGRKSIVVSIVENRAREICVSKVDTSNNSLLEILLLADNHSYNETINSIRMINPDEILLHDGTRNGILAKKIELECRHNARILFISRQYFDQDRGADMLKKVLVREVDCDMIAKYTVLSGAYCLLRYVENCSGFNYARNSMRVEFGSLASNKMVIDRRTAVNLELISNSRTGCQKESLFGSIDHTKTVVGGRLLRSNILSPPTDIPTINTRLDIVELYLRNNRIFMEIVALLQQFPDLDKMLSGLTHQPKKVTQKTASTGIDTLIFLKQALKTAPALAGALQQLNEKYAQQEVGPSKPSHPLLAAILSNLTDPSLHYIEGAINALLTDSTSFSKSAHEMRHQECFALRTGIHGLLDVSRKTFLQTVEDLYTLAEKHSSECGVPIKVAHSSLRGYYLIVPNALDPLPPEFTQAVLNRRTISCSTEEFSSLSNRAALAITQALTLTHELIQSLLEDIRTRIDSLFTLTDSVALLDMLVSFADLVALTPHVYTRPLLNLDGPLVIQAGRHPVISTLPLQQMTSSFVANDLFLSPLENLHLITGPNGSGKTVYIKQAALITIMAQMGSFVPAKHVTVPVRDRIMSRLGTSDDMEHNMSTFFTEMKEIGYVLSNLTDRSLVIVDELGRGTSTIDGLSIAFAIAEHLLDTTAMTLFVTHYPQVTVLAQIYPQAKNVHMKTSIDLAAGFSPSLNTSGIKYLHEVITGPCDMRSGYGVVMAEQCGFPSDVLADARTMRTIVRDTFPVLTHDFTSGTSEGMCAVSTLLQRLLLLKNSHLDSTATLHYLQNLRSNIPDSVAQEILAWITGSDR